MVEVDVIRCIRELEPVLGKTCVIETQNGVHPIDKTFVLVGKISEFNMGTASRTLTSRDGYWTQSQTVGYQVNIAFQGIKDGDARGSIDSLKMLLDIPPVRQIFMDAGYTYDIHPNSHIIPIRLDTCQYEKHIIKLTLKTRKTIRFKQDTIKSVGVEGSFVDDNGTILQEYKETITGE